MRLKEGTEDFGDGGPLSDSSSVSDDVDKWKIDRTRLRATRLDGNDVMGSDGAAIHKRDEKAEEVGVKAPKASVRFTDVIAKGDEEVVIGGSDKRLARLVRL